MSTIFKVNELVTQILVACNHAPPLSVNTALLGTDFQFSGHIVFEL